MRYWTLLIGWVRSHEVLLAWLSAASVVMFFGTLLVMPWLVTRIPSDYFLHRRHFVDHWRRHHPLVRTVLLTAKNLCGVVLLLAGVAMLVLPGQGILTILIGLTLIDFPGKFGLEQRIARRPAVLGAMNWIRAKAHQPPLESPPPPEPRPPCATDDA